MGRKSTHRKARKSQNQIRAKRVDTTNPSSPNIFPIKTCSSVRASRESVRASRDCKLHDAKDKNVNKTASDGGGAQGSSKVRLLPSSRAAHLRSGNPSEGKISSYSRCIAKPIPYRSSSSTISQNTAQVFSNTILAENNHLRDLRSGMCTKENIQTSFRDVSNNPSQSEMRSLLTGAVGHLPITAGPSGRKSTSDIYKTLISGPQGANALPRNLHQDHLNIATHSGPSTRGGYPNTSFQKSIRRFPPGFKDKNGSPKKSSCISDSIKTVWSGNAVLRNNSVQERCTLDLLTGGPADKEQSYPSTSSSTKGGVFTTWNAASTCCSAHIPKQTELEYSSSQNIVFNGNKERTMPSDTGNWSNINENYPRFPVLGAAGAVSSTGSLCQSADKALPTGLRPDFSGKIATAGKQAERKQMFSNVHDERKSPLLRGTGEMSIDRKMGYLLDRFCLFKSSTVVPYQQWKENMKRWQKARESQKRIPGNGKSHVIAAELKELSGKYTNNCFRTTTPDLSSIVRIEVPITSKILDSFSSLNSSVKNEECSQLFADRSKAPDRINFLAPKSKVDCIEAQYVINGRLEMQVVCEYDMEGAFELDLKNFFTQEYLKNDLNLRHLVLKHNGKVAMIRVDGGFHSCDLSVAIHKLFGIRRNSIIFLESEEKKRCILWAGLRSGIYEVTFFTDLVPTSHTTW